MNYSTPKGYTHCPECNNLLGDRIRAVDTAVIEFYKSKVNTPQQLNQMMLHSVNTEPIGWILDAVGLTNECCRGHMANIIDVERAF